MGTDKAFVAAAGRPLVTVARDALLEAGAGEVLAVGATGARAERLQRLGLRPVPDGHPGAGPLGGVLTALDGTALDPVVVLACDLAGVGPDAVHRLLGALAAEPLADAVIAVAGGRDQPLLGAWRRRARVGLRAAFAGGERSLGGAVATVDVVRVGVPAAWAHNVNAPGDLLLPRADGE